MSSPAPKSLLSAGGAAAPSTGWDARSTGAPPPAAPRPLRSPALAACPQGPAGHALAAGRSAVAPKRQRKASAPIFIKQTRFRGNSQAFFHCFPQFCFFSFQLLCGFKCSLHDRCCRTGRPSENSVLSFFQGTSAFDQ